jgi:hypothetical protein
MDTQVVLLFLCTTYQVRERSLQDALNVLLQIEEVPHSVETIAERAAYSTRQMARILDALSWHDERRGIPPVVMRSHGKKGIPYQYVVNKNRAHALGLIHAA